MKTKDFFRLLILVFPLLFVACNDGNTEGGTPDSPSKQIVILYDNDVHCSVDGYPFLVALRNECLSVTQNVSTVSCGDFASGGIVGAISKGEQIVPIMNHVGYDAIVLGNHELDYGIPQMYKITESLEAPVLCANLINENIRDSFQVILLPNLYGDIITDEAAQIQGGVGTAGSANIGDKYAMFEAIHGSAPRMIAEGIGEYANPSSIFVAVGMLLRHIGATSAAEKLDKAMQICTETEKLVIVTGNRDGATCREFSDYLIETLKKI